MVACATDIEEQMVAYNTGIYDNNNMLIWHLRENGTLEHGLWWINCSIQNYRWPTNGCIQNWYWWNMNIQKFRWRTKKKKYLTDISLGGTYFIFSFWSDLSLSTLCLVLNGDLFDIIWYYSNHIMTCKGTCLYHRSTTLSYVLPSTCRFDKSQQNVYCKASTIPLQVFISSVIGI